jgi:hypothetical protein
MKIYIFLMLPSTSSSTLKKEVGSSLPKVGYPLRRLQGMPIQMITI